MSFGDFVAYYCAIADWFCQESSNVQIFIDLCLLETVLACMYIQCLYVYNICKIHMYIIPYTQSVTWFLASRVLCFSFGTLHFQSPLRLAQCSVESCSRNCTIIPQMNWFHQRKKLISEFPKDKAPKGPWRQLKKLWQCCEAGETC